MFFNIGNKKIFVFASLIFLSGLAKSQLRTDGYYSSTKFTKTGDTTFHILCFASNGAWTDTSGTGMSPTLIRIPPGRNNERCTYARNGNDLTLTAELINLSLYHVSNCPCKYKVRIEDDGIFVIEWRDNNKNKRIIKERYLFVPFQSNN